MPDGESENLLEAMDGLFQQMGIPIYWNEVFFSQD